VAGPADALQVVDVEKQIEVSFVRFDVMHHCGPWVCSPSLERYTAAFVLASVSIP